jgi:hypothetical protein
MVFWWTGRGYLALLTLIGVYGVFGVIVQFTLGEDAFDRWRFLWPIGAVISAAITWYAGCRLNGRSMDVPSPAALRRRLSYPAESRFLSLPLENWAFPMLVLAVCQIVYALQPHR